LVLIASLLAAAIGFGSCYLVRSKSAYRQGILFGRAHFHTADSVLIADEAVRISSDAYRWFCYGAPDQADGWWIATFYEYPSGYLFRTPEHRQKWDKVKVPHLYMEARMMEGWWYQVPANPHGALTYREW
jgi:hypothetical protein